MCVRIGGGMVLKYKLNVRKVTTVPELRRRYYIWDGLKDNIGKTFRRVRLEWIVFQFTISTHEKQGYYLCV